MEAVLNNDLGNHQSNVSPNSNDDDETDLLICAICHKLVEDPRYLPCLHTFCYKCLISRDRDKDKTNDVIRCPTCQQLSKLPNDDVTGWPRNIIVAQMKEDKTASDKLKENIAPIECTNCTRNLRDAVARCVACDDFMCQRCLESHNMIRALKQHLVISITEFRTGKVPHLNSNGLRRLDLCSIHKRETLQFYCETCGVVMCRDCTVVHHPRPEHRYVDIEEGLRQQEKAIQLLVNQCNRVDKDVQSNLIYSKAVSQNVQMVVKDAKQALEQCVENIKSKFLENLERNRHTIKSELSELERNREAAIRRDTHHLSSVKSRLDVALNLSRQLEQMTMSMKSDVAAANTMVASALRSVCSEDLVTTDQKLASIEFIPSSEMLDMNKFTEIGRVCDGMIDDDASGPVSSLSSPIDIHQYDDTQSIASMETTSEKDPFEIGTPNFSSTRKDSSHYQKPVPTIVANNVSHPHRVPAPLNGVIKVEDLTNGVNSISGEKHARIDTNVTQRNVTQDPPRHKTRLIPTSESDSLIDSDNSLPDNVSGENHAHIIDTLVTQRNVTHGPPHKTRLISTMPLTSESDSPSESDNSLSEIPSRRRISLLPPQTLRDEVSPFTSWSPTAECILERSFGHKSDGETTFAWGVCTNASSEIIVTNQQSALGMSVFSPDGQYRRCVPTKSKNRDVVVINDEYFVISRTKFVRVYNRNGRYLRQFHAVVPASSSSTTLLYTVNCMAKDPVSELIVLGASYSRSACVSIHRPDGTHVSSFKIGIEPTFIAVTSRGHVVVSSHPDRTIWLLDPAHGCILTSIEPPEGHAHNWQPSGVCCSKTDDIYVANKTTDENRGIYRYTGMGRYIGCITTVVASPYGLALTNDDQRLLVADYQSVKVFQLRCEP